MDAKMEAYTAKVIENMEKKTGKKLAEFVEILRASGLTKFKEQVNWLKEHHGLGNTQAQIVAWELAKPADFVEPSNEELLANMYKGKESLKPIYDKVIAVMQSIGSDWEYKYCQTYVALTRGRQFLAIQPSTKSRVDLGLVLTGMEHGGRLMPAKNVGSGRTSHMVSLTTPDQVDAEVAEWLRLAYVAAQK